MKPPTTGWVEFVAHDLPGVAAAMRAGAQIPLAAFVALQAAVAHGASVALVMDRHGGVATVYGPTAWLAPVDARALRAAGWRAGREPGVGGVYDLQFEVAVRRANPAASLPQTAAAVALLARYGIRAGLPLATALAAVEARGGRILAKEVAEGSFDAGEVWTVRIIVVVRRDSPHLADFALLQKLGFGSGPYGDFVLYAQNFDVG